MTEFAEWTDTLFKISVSQELLQDCQLDILSFLANPTFEFRAAVPLTRREKIRRRFSGRRVALAERAYKLISGREVQYEDWDY